MSRLGARLLSLAFATTLVAGCSDPYQHGDRATTSAPSSGVSSTVTTPDLGQFTGAAPSSAELQAAAKTARAFVGPYLLYTYAQAKTSQIPAADPILIAQLAANPPSVPSSIRSRHPKVTSLLVSGGQTGQVAFRANVSDGTDTYAIPLTVTHEQNRWLVTSVQ